MQRSRKQSRTQSSSRKFRGNIGSPSKRRSKRMRKATVKGFSVQQLKSVGVSSEQQARNLIDTFEQVSSPSAPTSSPETSSPSFTVEMGEFEGKPVAKSFIDLINYTSDKKFKESWKIVCWVHSKYKHEVYTGAYLSALKELNTLKDKVEMKMETFEIPETEKWKMMVDDAELNSIVDVVNQFKMLADHCRLKTKNLETNTSYPTLTTTNLSLATRVTELKKTLKEFAHKNMQHEISDFVAKLLLAFFQNPFFPRSKFFSFMFVGPPGTGKTTIAKEISKVLIASGLFEGDFYDKGKSDFIGQYLGQTPHITKKALTLYALEGVLFIDEAYSLCNLDNDGHIDMYGLEFATVLVDFMTRFKGLNCIITAGYEPEMKSQFLAANDGIPRRFPHRFLLNDLNTTQLNSIVDNFTRDLLRPKNEDKRDVPRPSSKRPSSKDDESPSIKESPGSKEEQSPFTKEATKMVSSFIDEVRANKKSSPNLYKLIENQAGSASNIAEFISTVALGQESDRFFKASEGLMSEDAVRNTINKEKKKISVGAVRDAFRTIVSQAEMSNSKRALRDLDKMFP